MRRLAALGLLLVLTACTPAEVRGWLAWNEADPVAAQQYLVDHPATASAQAVRLDTDGPQFARWQTWLALAECESGSRWDYNGSSGFDGGLQFLPSTWRAMDGPTPYAWQATREQQIEVAERLLAVSGWGAWPGCARKLGLR